MPIGDIRDAFLIFGVGRKHIVSREGATDALERELAHRFAGDSGFCRHPSALSSAGFGCDGW